MGSSIGFLMADLTMSYVIDKAAKITPLDCQPKFFCRYVEDCVPTFANAPSFSIFLRYLNREHNQIQFTGIAKLYGIF